MAALSSCTFHSPPPSNDQVFVSNEATSSVAIVDGATGKVEGQLATGPQPRGMAFSPDRKIFYVAASNANRIEAWDVATHKLRRYLNSGSDPERFAVSPDGKTIYIANEDDSAVSFLDLTSGKITREVKVGPEPEGVGVSPDGKLVVATSETANLAHFIDTGTGKLLDSVPVGSRPRFVLFLNGGKTVWVSSEQRGTISVFDAATHRIVHTIDLNQDFDIAEPVQAIEMRATRGEKRIFVAMGRSNRVAELDPRTYAVRALVSDRRADLGHRPLTRRDAALRGERAFGDADHHRSRPQQGDEDGDARRPAVGGDRSAEMKVLAVLVAALLLGSCNLVQPKVLTACADPNNLPFSNKAGQGFENKLAEMIASDLHAKLKYVWWAQRRGYVRNTLNERACDFWPGVGSNVERLATSRPYYRSAYMFVTRESAGLKGLTLDDPRLKHLKIGVQMVGNDGVNTPPAHALSRRGIVDNVRGYMLYGDYRSRTRRRRS